MARDPVPTRAGLHVHTPRAQGVTRSRALATHTRPQDFNVLLQVGAAGPRGAPRVIAAAACAGLPACGARPAAPAICPHCLANRQTPQPALMAQPCPRNRPPCHPFRLTAAALARGAGCPPLLRRPAADCVSPPLSEVGSADLFPLDRQVTQTLGDPVSPRLAKLAAYSVLLTVYFAAPCCTCPNWR